MCEVQASPKQSTEMQTVLDFLTSKRDVVWDLGEEDLPRHTSRPPERQVRLHCFKRDEPYNCHTCHRTNVEATYIIWLRPASSGTKCYVDVERRMRYYDQHESIQSGNQHTVSAGYLIELGITPKDLIRGFVSHFKCKAAGLRATADRCLLVNGAARELFPHLISVKDAA